MILHRFCLCEKFHGHTPVRVWTETKNFVDLRFFDPEKLRNPEAGDPQLDYAVDFMARKTASGN